MGDGNQSWEAEGNVCGERVQSKMCIHRIPRTPGCRRDTSGRSLLHDHFVSKKLSEKEERAYLGGI